MPNKKFTFNGNTYEYSLGSYYKNGFRIREAAFNRAYASYTGRVFEGGRRVVPRSIPTLDSHWKKQLWGKSQIKGSPWNNAAHRLRAKFKPLTLNDKNPYFGRVHYSATSRTNAHWGAILNKKNGSRNVGVFNGFEEWLRHIQIAHYQIGVQAEHFRITVGQRALRIFQESFEKHKFVNGDRDWQELATYTQEKRRRKGTWHGSRASKLNEYGLLAKSLDITQQGNKTHITTKKVTSHRKNKKGVDFSVNFSYASIHNEGVPKGRKPGKRIPKRQFMGWTNSNSMDKIDRFAYSVADRYLFDSVFLYKKGK